MPRYIDADMLKKFLHEEDFETPDERWRPESEFAKMIDACQTVDAVEVVRCKDCDFSRKTEETDELVRCRITGYRRELEHFCAYGVKGGESHD